MTSLYLASIEHVARDAYWQKGHAAQSIDQVDDASAEMVNTTSSPLDTTKVPADAEAQALLAAGLSMVAA